MASGMPISWMPMSAGWKSISGTAKRSFANRKICSPVLYFPLKTISSRGLRTERPKRRKDEQQPRAQNKTHDQDDQTDVTLCVSNSQWQILENVFSPCRNLFWWSWNLEEHNPSSQSFPPLSSWQQSTQNIVSWTSWYNTDLQYDDVLRAENVLLHDLWLGLTYLKKTVFLHINWALELLS